MISTQIFAINLLNMCIYKYLEICIINKNKSNILKLIQNWYEYWKQKNFNLFTNFFKKSKNTCVSLFFMSIGNKFNCHDQKFTQKISLEVSRLNRIRYLFKILWWLLNQKSINLIQVSQTSFTERNPIWRDLTFLWM